MYTSRLVFVLVSWLFNACLFYIICRFALQDEIELPFGDASAGISPELGRNYIPVHFLIHIALMLSSDHQLHTDTHTHHTHARCKDRERREAVFMILCIVRFVRQGLTVPEAPAGSVILGTE